MKRIEPIFVTALWDMGLSNIEQEKYAQVVHNSLQYLSGKRVFCFYDSGWAHDLLRHEAHDLKIKMICCHFVLEEFAEELQIDAFMNRTKLYGMSQHISETEENFLEKSKSLYWLCFLKFGEERFRKFMIAKMSKIHLCQHICEAYVVKDQQELVWVDPDFAQYLPEKSDWEYVLHAPFGDTLKHFTSTYRYLGMDLPIGSFCLSAPAPQWGRLLHNYITQIDRLKNFPYVYDEEVVLSLLKAQKPSDFALFYDRSEEQNLSRHG